jgi:hypothetical protein
MPRPSDRTDNDPTDSDVRPSSPNRKRNRQKLNAVPVNSNNRVNSSIISLKSPTIINKNTLDEIDSTNEVNLINNNVLVEVDDGANSSARIFTLNTGFSDIKPTVVFSSEFIPLYESGARNNQGRSILLKEGAKIVNAKTAITVLSQTPEVSSSISSNRSELQNYINEESYFLGQLIPRTNQILSSLDIRHYSVGNLSFKNTLERNGFFSNKIVNFTNTKLWQQSLIETKKALVSHTSEFISQNFSRSSIENDSDPFKMSDIDEAPNNLKKLWLNPYGVNLPTFAQISAGDKNTKPFTDYDNYRFVNLKYANIEEKKIVVTGPNPTSSPEAGQLFFSIQALNSFQTSGKDISILANMIFKEACYSSFLGKKENIDTLKNKFGYDIPSNGDNFSMWDYVIGQASKNVTDFFSYPAGNGNSLISFSQRKIPQGPNNYRVLTLQNDYLEGTNTTPGSYYYVDSSLSTIDGRSFDLSRLEDLNRMTNSSRETTRMIIEALGHEVIPALSRSRINNSFSSNNSNLILNERNDVAPVRPNNESEDTATFGESYPRKFNLTIFDLTDLVDKLSIVTKFYQNYLELSNDSLDSLSIQRLKTENMKSSKADNKGTRLAAILCKCLSNPVASYRNTVRTLKPLVFFWLMNTVINQTQKTNSNVPNIKEDISNAFSYIKASLSDSEVLNAIAESRNFPISVGETSAIGENIIFAHDNTLDSPLNDPTFYDKSLTLMDVWKWAYTVAPEDFARFDALSFNNVLSTGNVGVDLVITGPQSDVTIVIQWVNSFIREYNNKEINNERNAAKRMYADAARETLFEIDESQGLWRVMIDILKTFFTNTEIFTNEVTNYSRISKVGYMYNLFDLMLRIIASQTPENLLGVSTYNYQYKSDISISAGGYTEDSIGVSETGFLVSRVEADQLNSHYNTVSLKKDLSSPASKTVNHLSDAIDFLEQESKSVIHEIGLYRKYFFDLGISISQYKTFLSDNFQTHLDKLVNLFQQDGSLSDTKKKDLINLTFSHGQIKMSNYYISELSDRISQTEEVATRLKTQPSFSSFPNKFIDYMPVNETELVSYSMLSPYFKSNEFSNAKGNNKKIISVGIPPNLIQKLIPSVKFSTSNILGLRRGLIRISLYKKDLLCPAIVYKPQVYLFDMNRYPTRVISNWNYETFIKDETNLLSVPSKLIKPDGTVLLHKDYTEAFPVALYSDYLKDEEKLQLYANHSISFLSEEYLRWFTDCRFDEVRYNNFSTLTSNLSNSDQQTANYFNIARNSSGTQQASTNNSSVTAQFFDKVSGTNFNVPVNRPNNIVAASSLSNKSYVIPMNDTIKTFFMNETFLLDTNVYKRRISYPKKFDRVFNMIVDPDDFVVDESMSTKTTLDTLVNLGVLSGGSLGDIKVPYKHRDKSPDDITYDEYFVTVEPYDYVQEYEV